MLGRLGHWYQWIFNVESVITYIMNSSKREKTPWTKLRKKPRPKKNDKGECLFNESSRKEYENKAYPSKFMAATTFFGIVLGWLEVWFFGDGHNFCSLCWLVPFPFTVSSEAFLIIFLRIQWAVFVADAWGSKACVSLVGGLNKLTATLMRCDKLSKL